MKDDKKHLQQELKKSKNGHILLQRIFPASAYSYHTHQGNERIK